MLAASALKALKGLLLALLCILSLAEIYQRSRAMIYAPDEIYNLDPIITFYSTLDYTTASQGGHPFDPVLSAGILATWLNGLVFWLGGTLFTGRLISGVTHFLIAIGLAFGLLRCCTLRPIDAAVVAVAVWAAMIPVGSHELRVINGGELWGFFYVAAGAFFVRKSPRTAAFFGGLSTWLVKIIYLPFAAALLLALAFTDARERDGSKFSRAFLDSLSRLALPFFLPLLLWMALIWLRYDTRTLLVWASTYVTFVAKHATDVSLTSLPVLDNWNFHPPWNDPPFLSWGWRSTRSYLLPLGMAAIAFLTHTVLRFLGLVRPTLREAACVGAVSAALALELIWFFAFDPTQWGRHLMPCIYVAVALGLYCLADIWRAFAASPKTRWILGIGAYATILLTSYVSYAFTADYIASWSWRTSYSKTCRGLQVLTPPCGHPDTFLLISRLTKELCDSNRNPFDPAEDCMWRKRAEFLAYAMAVLEDPERQPGEVHAAGYLIIVMQAYDYPTESEFLADVAALICAKPAEPLHRRLSEAGLDVTWLMSQCNARSP